MLKMIHLGCFHADITQKAIVIIANPARLINFKR